MIKHMTCFASTLAAVTAFVLGLGWSASVAEATSLEANTVYALNGGLAGFLENELDGDDRFDLYIELAISGTVATGAITADGAFEFINVNYTVDGGRFLDISFDQNGVIVFGEQRGTVNPGATGVMNYTNAAVVVDGNGNQGAAVYTDSFDSGNPLPLGEGTGQLGGNIPEQRLSGDLFGHPFDNKLVSLDGKSQPLFDTIHEEDYLPFSLFGPFMASFGEHGGFGFTFHAWVMNSFEQTSNGMFPISFLAIGTEYNVFLDFHASLSPITSPPPSTEIPEPSSLILLASALFGAAYRRRED